MNYSLLKSILFRLDPETAHHVTLSALNFLHHLKITQRLYPQIISPQKVMGITFPNRVGLAAGLDKNGDYIEALADLGFGFLEVGTITKKPQIGNPKPRLFRLTKQAAIINRMGFNNKGVDYLVARLKKIKYQGVLGINIGKNKETPLDQASDEYRYLFECVAPFASYVTVNISSPNTEGLRLLQHGDYLQTLLNTLKKSQSVQKKYIPLVVKISPDLTEEELRAMVDVFLAEKIDGVIATNTTITRGQLADVPLARETGGLSGKPLFERSTFLVKQLNQLLKNQIPIIAAGGIFSAQDAKEKIQAGASLIQLYTGLIYEGPKLIATILQEK